MYDTRSFFNERAAIWDQHAQHDPDNIRTMLRLSDLRPGCCVLDVGCGTGFLEPFLLDCEPAVVLAVDFAENMIAAAREKLNHPAVEFVCADFFDIKKLLFDNLIFLSTFPHFPDPEKAVSHMASLLKTGGRATISHAQGKSGDGGGILHPMLPAQGLINLMKPYFRLDVIVDNPVMFMISGVKIDTK